MKPTVYRMIFMQPSIHLCFGIRDSCFSSFFLYQKLKKITFNDTKTGMINYNIARVILIANLKDTLM